MPEPIEVTATKGEKEATLTYDFGNNIEEARQMFGDDVVFTNFRQAAKISLQARMRSRLEKDQDVQELATIWKPGIQLERAPADPIAKAKNAFASMTPEQRLALLEELKSGI